MIGDHNNMGYRRVILYYDGHKDRYFVHRLVAQEFCKGYDDILVVNHIDGNKQNDEAKNLECVTRSENDLHAYDHGLRTPNISKPKHKVEKYDAITGNAIKIYNSAKECAKDLNVSTTSVYECCNGNRKSCKGYGLRYKK